MDDIYEPTNVSSTNAIRGLLSNSLNLILKAPLAFLITLSLAPLLVIIATRLLSGYAFHNARISGNNRKVEMIPYWIPVIGHAVQLYVPKSTPKLI